MRNWEMGSVNFSLACSSILREAEVDIAGGNNTEHNVHISVLGNDQTLDIYKCTDPGCEHFCTKTNKRYHCPLCNNKPQKPGRMRRHFEKMHSGKQIVQHEGVANVCAI